MVNEEKKIATVKVLAVIAEKPYFIPKIEYIDGIGDADNKIIANTMGSLNSSTIMKHVKAIRAGCMMSFPTLVHAISVMFP